jgi:hypothetical protein
VAPDWLLGVISPDWFDRYVHRFELPRFPKGKQAQAILQMQVGEDSWRLLQAAMDEHTPQRVRDCPSLVLLQQVWNQHFERIDDVVRWRDGPLVPNAERVVSPYKTDARASRKRGTEWLGYKVHLTETCSEEESVHLTEQAEITAATMQDVEETMPLLRDLQAHNLVPEVRLVDSGYVSGQVLAEHAELGIELVGPLKQEGGWQHETGYGVSAFQVDWQKQQARCSPRASLTELVPRTTQPRRGGDTGELFRRHLSCLSSQRALYQEGAEQRQNPDALTTARA